MMAVLMFMKMMSASVVFVTMALIFDDCDVGIGGFCDGGVDVHGGDVWVGDVYDVGGVDM